MKLLIVEGNNQETRNKRGAFGIEAYYSLFSRLVKMIVPKADITCVFPADSTQDLPSQQQLQLFDGVLWTGSSLSVLDIIPDVSRQLSFAEEVFQSGVPFYGSCWGLQIATIVAGGTVVKGDKGLELGVSNPIELTAAGKKSLFLNHRKGAFQALCIHYDEVGKLPNNAVILAYNSHSKVQAMEFQYKNSNFFGVQYHPEFTPEIMATISSFLSDNLIKSGYFLDRNDANIFIQNLNSKNKLPQEITDYQMHYQEISVWLNNLNS